MTQDAYLVSFIQTRQEYVIGDKLPMSNTHTYRESKWGTGNGGQSKLCNCNREEDFQIKTLKLINQIFCIGQFYSDEARIIGDKPPASNEWPIIGNGSQKGRGYRYYWGHGPHRVSNKLPKWGKCVGEEISQLLLDIINGFIHNEIVHRNWIRKALEEYELQNLKEKSNK